MNHPAFELIREHSIPALRLTLQDYRHRVTAARHIHLASEDNNNVFLVAFLTVPQDSTGIAHILEHTALCGSQRYPVRDPFFMMIRRSLNTFMNAFTGADWTAYPFASQNRKDFNNLLGVYLDAAFFPLLDELDFAQEGWRLEYAEPDNPESELQFKGVVYNEMKGVLSAPTNRLHEAVQHHLYPTVTYHHNSGGDPIVIPELTHADLQAFHARHYHPSNALFMTYGDIPAGDHQQHFEERVLSRFQALDVDFSIPDEQRYPKPQRVVTHYPVDGEDTQRKTHIVLSWLLESNTDAHSVLETQLLSDVLLDNASSPLRRALETTDLGTAPSPLCGYSANNRETAFFCGLEGSDPEQADAVEQLILDTLTQVAEQGVDPDSVEAMLHQLELSQREISGDGFPYGLQLIMEALTPAIHGGDPVAALDLDAHLEQLRHDSRAPHFIPDRVRRLLLDNPHRVRVVMQPDPQLAAAEAAAEQTRLQQRAAQLTAADQQQLVARAQALLARQNQQDDPEQLPRVTLADVAPDMNIPEGTTHTVNHTPITGYERGTNGMVYGEIMLELPQLNPELQAVFPLYITCLTEVGCNGRDYLAQQAHQAANVGSIGASCMIRNVIGSERDYRAVLVIAGKALARKQAALSELLFETLSAARFDELTRLRELIAQIRAAREAGVTRAGHALAMTAAASGSSPIAAMAHRWDGLAGLQHLKALDNRLDTPEALATLAEQFTAIHQQLQTAPRHILLVGEAEQQTALRDAFSAKLSTLAPAQPLTPFALQPTSGQVRQGWRTGTQVNFCAAAWDAVEPDHADAPALMVLGGFLRNGYLHRAIREQGGAYGGGASYNPDSATFRMFSYRDPRLAATFADFQGAVDWLMSANHDAHSLEEAILGVISAIDKPGSPAGEAISSFFAEQFGRTPEWRRAFRQQVLSVSLDDLKRVADQYLQPATMHQAAISSGERLAAMSDWTQEAL